MLEKERAHARLTAYNFNLYRMAAPANIDPNSAVYATDEYGRPFIIVREGQKKSRLSGIEAIRVSALDHLACKYCPQRMSKSI